MPKILYTLTPEQDILLLKEKEKLMKENPGRSISKTDCLFSLLNKAVEKCNNG